MEPKKTGKNTSEFALTVGTAMVQVAGALLAAIGAVQGTIPDKWAAFVAVAVIFATAIQAAGYSLSRGKFKASKSAGLGVAELQTQQALVVDAAPTAPAATGAGDTPDVEVSTNV